MLLNAFSTPRIKQKLCNNMSVNNDGMKEPYVMWRRFKVQEFTAYFLFKLKFIPAYCFVSVLCEMSVPLET